MSDSYPYPIDYKLFNDYQVRAGLISILFHLKVITPKQSAILYQAARERRKVEWTQYYNDL